MLKLSSGLTSKKEASCGLCIAYKNTTCVEVSRRPNRSRHPANLSRRLAIGCSHHGCGTFNHGLLKKGSSVSAALELASCRTVLAMDRRRRCATLASENSLESYNDCMDSSAASLNRKLAAVPRQPRSRASSSSLSRRAARMLSHCRVS